MGAGLAEAGEVRHGELVRLLHGVAERLLSVEPLLFFILRRRARGAFVTS